jgi:hypothetical protein
VCRSTVTAAAIKTVRLAVGLALTVAFTFPSIASGFTVTFIPNGGSCAPAPSGPFTIVSTDLSHFFFRCTGAFEVRADPNGLATAGQAVSAEVVAPRGITITDASATGSIETVGSGWVDTDFFSGGDDQWFGGSAFRDPPFSSPYWGFQVWCPSACSGASEISLSSITLSATETSGPSLTPVGAGNLWYQNRPSEWIWNAPGDPWPLTLSASDPSGVCRMLAVAPQHDIPGPAAVPNTSRWKQCPDPTWTPSGGASVDTRDYLASAGSLPLTISATNAAGVATAYSETLHVDNEPVRVSLATPTDPNPNVWVNHSVAVGATATAGPSGVGGTTCSDDEGAPSAHPTANLTVDGDGIHTVSCTAWNNAVGPEGQPNSTTSTLAVHIDEAPPSITFSSKNPSDPTAVTVDARDAESGVAGGSVEMAPAGTGTWTKVPASFDGAHLAAHVDDAGLRGSYTIRATSCDNVGNCATATEPMTLPVRAAADSAVSLTRIVNPVRRRVVVKRVRVGWHWATVRHGNQLVRVKRGGHFKTVKITEYVQTCTAKAVRTGPGRSCPPPHIQVTSSLQVPYGHTLTIHGLYTTGQGVPLSGQTVRLLAAPDNGFGVFSQVATATTAGDGSWTATLPPGPSRIIRAVTDGTATILPSSGQVTAIVPAKIRLIKVWPQHVAWGGTVHLVGQLFGGYLPSKGALVRLRIGYGSTYNTYGVEEHVKGDGRFSTVATFGPGDPSISRTYWFQIASLPMGNYPFAPAASQRVPVIVGGHP